MNLFILALSLLFSSDSKADVNHITCETMGIASLRGELDLTQDLRQTDSGFGYELDMRSHPGAESSTVEISVGGAGFTIFSTTQTVSLSDEPHELFIEFAGDFWINCWVD